MAGLFDNCLGRDDKSGDNNLTLQQPLLENNQPSSSAAADSSTPHETKIGKKMSSYLEIDKRFTNEGIISSDSSIDNETLLDNYIRVKLALFYVYLMNRNNADRLASVSINSMVGFVLAVYSLSTLTQILLAVGSETIGEPAPGEDPSWSHNLFKMTQNPAVVFPTIAVMFVSIATIRALWNIFGTPGQLRSNAADFANTTVNTLGLGSFREGLTNSEKGPYVRLPSEMIEKSAALIYRELSGFRTDAEALNIPKSIMESVVPYFKQNTPTITSRLLNLFALGLMGIGYGTVSASVGSAMMNGIVTGVAGAALLESTNLFKRLFKAVQGVAAAEQKMKEGVVKADFHWLDDIVKQLDKTRLENVFSPEELNKTIEKICEIFEKQAKQKESKEAEQSQHQPSSWADWLCFRQCVRDNKVGMAKAGAEMV